MRKTGIFVISVAIGALVAFLTGEHRSSAEDDDACKLGTIHDGLVDIQRQIRESPPYNHASHHDAKAIELINDTIKQLNEGCEAFKKNVKP